VTDKKNGAFFSQQDVMVGGKYEGEPGNQVERGKSRSIGFPRAFDKNSLPENAPKISVWTTWSAFFRQI